LDKGLSENSSLKNVLSEVKDQVKNVESDDREEGSDDREEGSDDREEGSDDREEGSDDREERTGLSLFLERLTSSGETDLVSEVIISISKVSPNELEKFGWYNDFRERFGGTVRLWFLFGLDRVEQEYE